MDEDIDSCSEIGARRLAERMQAFWHERGYGGFVAEVIAVDSPKRQQAGDRPFFGVLSNCRNGLPPRLAA